MNALPTNVLSALAQIAEILQTGQSSGARIEHALTVLRGALPYDRCCLLDATDKAEVFYTKPRMEPEEHTALQERLLLLLRMTRGSGDSAGPAASVMSEPVKSHLALPLAGLEDVIGILFIEKDEPGFYDENALRLFSIVAWQIGTYLTNRTILRMQAERANEIARAHDFQQLLVGVVSHDLRNPLASMLMSTSVLLRRSTDERQIAMLGRITSSGERALRILADLLDVTRVRTTGTFPITKAMHDVVVVVRDVVDELAVAYPARELVFTLEKGTVKTLVSCDADRISQAVGNVVSNALQYAAAQTPITITLALTPTDVRVSVHNHGDPIPSSLLANIFDPFRRGAAQEPGRPKARNLGLGLYIVDQALRAHGGSVSARSTVAEGTTFEMTFPRDAS